MSEKAKPLTPEQKRIIEANKHKFPADISHLTGMNGTTSRQISDYLRRLDDDNPHKALAAQLREYISANGLPAKYGKVVEFIDYLMKLA